MMNLTTFFAWIRKAPFGGRLTQSQVEGVNAILDAWRAYGDEDPRKLAYVLATAFHEVGGRMQPVREGFAKTDAAARRIVARRRYGRPVNGHVYYGRGLVQLTWEKNYRAVGERLGLDLVNSPDLALDTHNSARILVIGMMEGTFTGKKLADYFSDAKDDPEGARRIVNGTDKASLIAGYSRNFLDSLEASKEAPKPVEIVAAQPDGADLKKDKTAIGGILAGVGGIGGCAAVAKPILEGIASPWAFLAFALVAVGVFLVVTGRVELKVKGGV